MVSTSRLGDSKSTVVRASRASSASRVLRSLPLRGRKPSNAKRSIGNPDSTSAARAALGPGTTRTSSPASATTRTRRAPGSETPGVPASVTYATCAPRWMSPTRSAARWRSLCSCSATSRRRPVTPACVSSARVRRVSSAQITSASRSASTARGERSPRFPMGVATSTSRPMVTLASLLRASRRRPRARLRSAVPNVRRSPTRPRSRTRHASRAATRASDRGT